MKNSRNRMKVKQTDKDKTNNYLKMQKQKKNTKSIDF